MLLDCTQGQTLSTLTALQGKPVLIDAAVMLLSMHRLSELLGGRCIVPSAAWVATAETSEETGK